MSWGNKQTERDKYFQGNQADQADRTDVGGARVGVRAFVLGQWTEWSH